MTPPLTILIATHTIVRDAPWPPAVAAALVFACLAVWLAQWWR